MLKSPEHMLPHCPEPPQRISRQPAEIPTQSARDDLEMAAWGIGEYGTKKQVARAWKTLWKILQETRKEPPHAR